MVRICDHTMDPMRSLIFIYAIYEAYLSTESSLYRVRVVSTVPSIYIVHRINRFLVYRVRIIYSSTRV